MDEVLDFLRGQINKSSDALAEEVKSKKSKSQVSDAVQQRMNNKLKRNVKAMKKAGQVGMALEAMGDRVRHEPPDIEEEKKEPKDGYNQLIDEKSDERINSGMDAGDEENLLKGLTDDYDDTLFRDLAEDDPLRIERRNLIKAKKDLDAYLEKRAGNKKKPTQQEQSMKASLQKRLLAQQEKFKLESKKAMAVKREVQKMEMLESGQEVHKNIILPKYELNKSLNVYEEVDVPPSSLYKAVGYNDLEKVKVYMQGDDADKRSEAAARESLVKTKSVIQANAKLDDGMAALAEETRKTNVTNLHYRKFYEDELENDRQLFPDPDEPFVRIPIKRGQSRGLSKSWFSFFSDDKVDESGEVTNEKVVGYFKGRVKVINKEEQDEFIAAKDERMTEIFDLIR